MRPTFTPDVQAALGTRFHAMRGAVPGVRRVAFGPTFTTDRARGYGWMLVVELEDREVGPLSVSGLAGVQRPG